jgi:hypothetical protein
MAKEIIKTIDKWVVIGILTDEIENNSMPLPYGTLRQKVEHDENMVKLNKRLLDIIDKVTEWEPVKEDNKE